MHPGYGFLSENAALARGCAAAGLVFVGPRPEALEQFGDKARARALAQRCGIPVLEGTTGATTLDEARALLAKLGAGASLMIKAVAGGGGRGVRPVHSADELEKAFERCASEAKAAFGIGDLYVERWLPHARHVEVQVAGDASGAVSHFAERECSLQRRHQKLVEIAPAPWLAPALRERLHAAAVALARAAHYTGLGTVEFLVDADATDSFYFIEANARLQVEHTVTEEVPASISCRSSSISPRAARSPISASRRPDPRAARLCDAAARQHREAAREGWARAARVGHAQRVRAARRIPACAPTRPATSAMRATRASTRCSRR
jgi:acetyl/propionyl-CoA carboxylase alpha subunit